MKWVTRAGAKTDRVACPWLIQKSIDPGAQFALQFDRLAKERLGSLEVVSSRWKPDA